MSSRSAWKIPYISSIFFSKRFLGKKPSKIWFRNSLIPARFVSKSFYLYNGHVHLPVLVKPDMVGHKFGEFSITKVLGYRQKKKNKQKRKSKR